MPPRLLRPALQSISLEAAHEHFFEKVAVRRNHRIHLFGIIAFIYLDDIIILLPTKKSILSDHRTVVEDILDSGLTINHDKSLFEPTPQFEALGLAVDLHQGFLSVPVVNTKGYQKKARKFPTKIFMTPRKMAAILGRFRSLLPAVPLLLAFTDKIVRFVARSRFIGRHHQCFKHQVRQVTHILHTWPGSLVGVGNVVIPNNSLAGPVGSGGAHPTKARTPYECLGGIYAKPALVPGLRAVIRHPLWSRGLCEVQIDSHLNPLRHLQFYTP